MKNLNDRNFGIATKEFAEGGSGDSSLFTLLPHVQIKLPPRSCFKNSSNTFFKKMMSNHAQPGATARNHVQRGAILFRCLIQRQKPGVYISCASASCAPVKNYDSENINTLL